MSFAQSVLAALAVIGLTFLFGVSMVAQRIAQRTQRLQALDDRFDLGPCGTVARTEDELADRGGEA